MYQNIGKKAFKKDLTNTYKLLEALGNPHLLGKHIHIAGSNGKGSVSSMLASVLTEAGYKVGLYTSPHLVEYTERIRINGSEIDEAYVIGFVAEMQKHIEEIKPSFFELTVAMAFDYFGKKETDVNIIEVGLGGRLDSTNVLNPILSIITNISLEHTDMLGDRLSKIAFEKAGIIKQNIPVVIGEWTEETLAVFTERGKECNSKIYKANTLIPPSWVAACELKGSYQLKNLRTLCKSVEVLKSFDWAITDRNIIDGLSTITQNTGLKGRWQKVSNSPAIILDTAHNAAGFHDIVVQLDQEIFKHLHIVLGVVKEKDLTTVLAILPKEAKYYTCKPEIPRGMESALLNQKLKKAGYVAINAESAENALKIAEKAAYAEDLILVMGSNFVIADVLKVTKYGQ